MKAKLLNSIKNNYLAISFVFLGVVSFIATKDKNETPEAKQNTTTETRSVDTFIPRGFVLVPIEIANAESLNSLVGDIGGVVDLYLATNDKQKGGLKVGSKLKLVRAPLNPQQYAVLVSDSESPHLLSFPGPFIAVIQNPDEKGTKLRASGPARVQIQYQN
ncbi:MAG: hypothetical protein ACXVCP_10305 [Bdellovibrio sp.]